MPRGVDAPIGAPIWLIEGTYHYANGNNSKHVNLYASEDGFLAGERTARHEATRNSSKAHGTGWTFTYRTFKLEQPAWEQVND